jgi:hypothetical protein
MITIDANAIAGEWRPSGAPTSRPRDARARPATPRHTLRPFVRVGPGRVASSRARGERLIVLVTIRGITCVDIGALAALEYEV